MSGNIEAVFFKLGTRNVNHKRNKMTPVVLLPWKVPPAQFLVFVLTKDHLMMRVKTICLLPYVLPCLFQLTRVGTLKGWKWYLVFDKKRLEPREFPWQWHYGFYSVSFVINISGAKFEEHGFIFTEIFFLVLKAICIFLTGFG